jgi:NitT/TauT family transport system ATP-binding protein
MAERTSSDAGSDTASLAVSLRGVTKTYDSGVMALGPVDLDLRRGEFVSLLGPSGCGKSTALRLIAGLAEPSAGSVRVSHPAGDLQPGRGIGFVFQEPTLMPWTSVRENVRLPLKLADVPAVDADARIAEALSRVGLSDFADNYPRELSGGMKMRVSLARALVTDPDILLMDEPFGALDAQTRVLLQEELARIVAAAKRTVVFVTHSIEEAVFLADRIVVMSSHPGKVRSINKVGLPRPRTARTRSLPDFINLTQELWDSLKPQWHDEGADAARPQHAT